MARNSGLGRGLSALIPEMEAARAPTAEVEIERIRLNPQQPRSTMDGEALEELTRSIKQHGIIQPLLVTETEAEDGTTAYQLIAGERRLRAAKAAGLRRVPVTVRESTPRELLELALIENVQREDLNPLEEALAYRRLVDEFRLTQQRVADRVGRSRTSVTNRLRLLELPPPVQDALAAREISEGHARALLQVEAPEERLQLLERVTREGLSVRQTERLARGARAPRTTRRAAPPPDPEIEALKDALRRNLGTKVSLRRSRRGSGALTIHFYSDEQLEGVLGRLLPADAL